MRNVRLGSLQATRPNSRKRCLGRACEKAEPQQVLCPSHCETAAGKMPKRRCWNPLKREMPKRCIWNLLKTKKKGCLKQGKPLRNVRLGSLQATRPNSRKRCLGRACEKAEPQQVLCPSHCETAAGKMPKRRFWNPLKRKKYSAQTMRNRSQKTAETLLLEPTKNKEKKSPQARQTFAQRKTWKPASHQAKLKKKVFGTRMRKGRTPAGFVPKPLRNRSRKNAETSRRCWNPLKRERNRAQTMRNRSQKTAETLLLDPTKNKEKTCKPPGQTQEGVWDAHAKRQNPSRFCAQAIAKPQPKKCRNVAVGTHYMRNRSQKTAETLLLEPTKNAEKRKMPKRCFWNLLKTKKKRLPQARQTFAQRKTWKPASHQTKLKKKVFGTRMRKGRTPAGFVPKPLRNRSRKNAETSLLEPIKKFKKKEIVPKPCETAH